MDRGAARHRQARKTEPEKKKPNRNPRIADVENQHERIRDCSQPAPPGEPHRLKECRGNKQPASDEFRRS